MPIEDARRWDVRYQEDQRFTRFERPRPFLEKHVSYLPAGGLALDCAMGLGGNCSFLLDRGLRVVGVDISGVAVRKAKARLPELMAVQADLTTFFLPKNRFDVILNFYYLQRDLWPRYQQALRPGGLLVFETLTEAMRQVQPEIDLSYLLGPGELRLAFPQLEIHDYQEGWSESDSGHSRATASLLARKPG